VLREFGEFPASFRCSNTSPVRDMLGPESLQVNAQCPREAEAAPKFRSFTNHQSGTRK
jgi:hypothetical protein